MMPTSMYIDFLHVQKLVATRLHSYNGAHKHIDTKLSMQRVYPVLCVLYPCASPHAHFCTMYLDAIASLLCLTLTLMLHCFCACLFVLFIVCQLSLFPFSTALRSMNERNTKHMYIQLQR